MARAELDIGNLNAEISMNEGPAYGGFLMEEDKPKPIDPEKFVAKPGDEYPLDSEYLYHYNKMYARASKLAFAPGWEGSSKRDREATPEDSHCMAVYVMTGLLSGDDYRTFENLVHLAKWITTTYLEIARQETGNVKMGRTIPARETRYAHNGKLYDKPFEITVEGSVLTSNNPESPLSEAWLRKMISHCQRLELLFGKIIPKKLKEPKFRDAFQRVARARR